MISRYTISQINYFDKSEFKKKKTEQNSTASIGNRLGCIILFNNLTRVYHN